MLAADEYTIPWQVLPLEAPAPKCDPYLLQPHGNHYLCRLLSPQERVGHILLSESAQYPTQDAYVIAAGPGRVLDNGLPWPMQAAMGDRLLFLTGAWREWDAEEQLGFVSDTQVVAILREGATVPEPANDYLLVRADEIYDQDALQEKESGVLVATTALVGGESWADQEGLIAYHESRRLWESVIWQAEPVYYRHRRLHNFLDGLHPEVRWKCLEYAKRDGREDDPEHMWVRREHPTSGTVLAVGPGRVWHDGRRWPRTARWSGAGLLIHEDGAWEVTYREDEPEWAPNPGEKVWWDYSHECVEIGVPGLPPLALIREQFLMATATE